MAVISRVIVLLILLTGLTELATAKTKKVTITSQPSGASVVIAGRLICTTPCETPFESSYFGGRGKPLLSDHIEITVSKDGYFSKTIKITSGPVVVRDGGGRVTRTYYFISSDSYYIRLDYDGLYLNQGNEHLNQGRYQEAITAYQMDLQLKPDRAESYFSIGAAYEKMNRLTDALGSFKRAIELQPDFAEAHYRAGLAHLMLGQREEAINAIKRSVQLNPVNADAHAHLGNLYKDLERYQDAVDAFKRALQLKPQLVITWRNLGFAYQSLHRSAEAVDAYRAAILSGDQDPETYLRLGFALANLGWDTNALVEFKRAADLKPGYSEAYYYSALSHSRLDQDQEARAAYQRSIQAFKRATQLGPWECFLLGNAYYELGEVQEALGAAREAVRLKPDFADAHLNLGWYFSMLDQNAEALEATQRAIQLQPDFRLAYTNLCRIHNDLRRYQDAITACGKALEHESEDGETLFYLGIALEKLGKRRRAMNHFGKAVESFKRKPHAGADEWYFIGNAHYKLGQFRDAIVAYQVAIRKKPTFAHAHFNLGLTYAAVSNRRATLAQCEVLKSLDPARAKILSGMVSKQR